MVDVTDGADVHVRLFTFEYSLGHVRNLQISLFYQTSFNQLLKSSWHWGLNPGPPPYQGGALPLSYASVIRRAAPGTPITPEKAPHPSAYRKLGRAESINRVKPMSMMRMRAKNDQNSPLAPHLLGTWQSLRRRRQPSTHIRLAPARTIVYVQTSIATIRPALITAPS